MILAFLTRHKNEDAKINASDDDADNHTDADDDTDNNAADMDANETPNNTDTKENPADDSEESAHCPDEPQPLKTLQQQQIEPEQLIMTTIISWMKNWQHNDTDNNNYTTDPNKPKHDTTLAHIYATASLNL